MIFYLTLLEVQNSDGNIIQKILKPGECQNTRWENSSNSRQAEWPSEAKKYIKDKFEADIIKTCKVLKHVLYKIDVSSTALIDWLEDKVHETLKSKYYCPVVSKDTEYLEYNTNTELFVQHFGHLMNDADFKQILEEYNTNYDSSSRKGRILNANISGRLQPLIDKYLIGLRNGLETFFVEEDGEQDLINDKVKKLVKRWYIKNGEKYIELNSSRKGKPIIIKGCRVSKECPKVRYQSIEIKQQIGRTYLYDHLLENCFKLEDDKPSEKIV